MTTGVQKLDMSELLERSRDSLYFFAKGVLGYDWMVPHIHGPICAELEDLSKNCKVFVLPRGWLKTTLCTISYPIWLSIQKDTHIYHGRNIRVLIVQNTFLNACKKLSVIRSQWETNPLLRGMCPDLLPTKNSMWRSEAACLTRSKIWPEATYEAAGSRTQVTGRHYDVIIEDDTVAPDLDELGEESLAPTTEQVQDAIGWHTKNVLPLLNNPATDLSLVVGTRWYDQDLIRHIIDKEPNYSVTTRACRETDGVPDPCGALTYPERFDDETLTRLATSLGSYMYSCLYMNQPVRREDMAFKSEWFKDYDSLPPTQSLAVYTTIDPATDPKLSKSGKTDYSVVMTCAKDLVTGFIYVLDYFRKRCNPGELVSAIFQHVSLYHPILVGYEDIAYQRSIDYYVKEEMIKRSSWFILEPLKLSKQKDAKQLRIAGLQPLFNAGVIRTKHWMQELKSELTMFPLGSYDDLPDALSMQLNLWKLTRIKNTYVHDDVNDPLSLEAAKKSIRDRKHRGSVVFQPANTGSFVFTGRVG